MSGAPSILVVTGASGAGKTTVVKQLAGRAIEGVGCFFFDSIGVPTSEAMKRDFGSGLEWQRQATMRWIERLSKNIDGLQVAVLDGQVRPTFVMEGFESAHVARGLIVLLDCSAETRRARLRGERGQPELVTPEMDCWAAYLRGQADALRLPVLDTTSLDVQQATAGLIGHIERIRFSLYADSHIDAPSTPP